MIVTLIWPDGGTVPLCNGTVYVIWLGVGDTGLGVGATVGEGEGVRIGVGATVGDGDGVLAGVGATVGTGVD